MWVKIRNFLVPLILNETTSKAVATAIMDVKSFIDTKDKRYINQAIDELQTLIK